MAEFPAMPLWTDAYLGDTRHFSTLQHGAYLLLLMCMWRNKGQLKNDDKLLARYAGLSRAQWLRVKPEIFEMMEVHETHISQKRLNAEYTFVRQKRDRLADNARVRWLKTKETGDAKALQLQSKSNAPTPTPTPNKKETPPPSAVTPLDMFENDQEEKKPAEKRGSRLPEDWTPSQKEIEYGQEQGFNDASINRIANDFADYWIAKPGAAGRKIDWTRTWQKWVRTEADRQSKQNRNQPRSIPERSRANAEAYVADRLGRTRQQN